MADDNDTWDTIAAGVKIDLFTMYASDERSLTTTRLLFRLAIIRHFSVIRGAILLLICDIPWLIVVRCVATYLSMLGDVNSTTYEELVCVRPAVSASHFTDPMVGPHLQRRGPPSY